MPQLICGGRSLECPPGNTVLDTLTAHGIPLDSGCRNGVCQRCLVRALAGEVPKAAQQSLAPDLQEQGHFLACLCRPSGPLEIAEPAAARRLDAQIVAVQRPSEQILALRLRPREPYAYRAGQFLRLYLDESTARCYSMASVPALDGDIELNIRRVPDGRVSGSLHRSAQPGQWLQISDAMGKCCYAPARADQPMLLIGTGCGLAPLLGIVREALHKGHAGPIRLYHGSRDLDGLYYVEELAALTRQHANFCYVPCVSGPVTPTWAVPGRALERALADCPELDGWLVYVCGHPQMVEAARKQTFLAGASTKDIHADPFVSN